MRRVAAVAFARGIAWGLLAIGAYMAGAVLAEKCRRWAVARALVDWTGGVMNPVYGETARDALAAVAAALTGGDQ